MNFRVTPKRCRCRGEGELMPRLSDWLKRPWSTAMGLIERPLTLLDRPLRDALRTMGPAVDISETDKDVVVRAEVPGLRQQDLALSYSQGVLTIEGERREREEHTRGAAMYRESRYGSFRREIPLGEDLKWEEAKAGYRDGVLSVMIPKTGDAVANGKKIDIE